MGRCSPFPPGGYVRVAGLVPAADVLHVGCSGPRWIVRSLSSCPRCHDAGLMGCPHRQHVKVSPVFMRRWYAARSRRCAARSPGFQVRAVFAAVVVREQLGQRVPLGMSCGQSMQTFTVREAAIGWFAPSLGWLGSRTGVARQVAACRMRRRRSC